MDSSVSDVRNFFRFRLHQMRWKNFMGMEKDGVLE
jgi:hypothetical protein